MLRLKPECKAEVVVEGEGVVKAVVEIEAEAVVVVVVEGVVGGVVEVGRRCFPAAYPPGRFS